MTNNHHQDSPPSGKSASGQSPGLRIWRGSVDVVIYIREWLRDLFFMLGPCRFSALMVIIVGVLLNFVPQCQEGLRALAERNEVQWLVIAQWSSFFIAAALVAFNAWYWARHMLNVQTISSHMLTSRRDTMRKYVPRVLGTLGLLSITSALWLAAKAYGPDDTPEVATAHHIMNTAIGSAAILTAVFYLFVQWRRHIFRLDWSAPVKTVKDLTPTTWWLLGSSAGLAFVLFLSFWFMPQHAGVFLGAPSIVLLAAATWIPFGSACVFLGLRYNVPALTMLFGSAVVFGLWNDNHQVHVITGSEASATQVSAPSARKTLDDAAHAWLQARQPELTAARASQQKYPVFIVATAGGGIRAAYWTATLLAGLEDHFPGQFARHTFGISGVSGGSVGSAAFVGLLAEQQAGNLQYRQGNHPNCEGMLRPWACAMLSQDFLSAVTGSMLYTDLTQRFLPFPVTSFDRGRTLEQSFERAWQAQGLPGDRMAQPFMDLWNDDNSYQLPLLFLNSTTVESGRRAIVSPVKIDAKNFRDAMDAVEIISKPMPLSTAAHLSARFTYVSPAGTVVDDKGNTVIHLVDGGYFENGGISTAKEVADAVIRAAQNQQLADNLCVKILVISNSQGYIADGTSYDGPPLRLLTEVMSPIDAVFNARNARARYAEAEVQASGQAVLFGLKQRANKAVLPLGWMLSDVAQHEIDQQVVDTVNNGDSTRKLSAMLKGAGLCD